MTEAEDRTAVTAFLRAAVGTVLNRETPGLDESTPLADIGIDSVLMIHLIVQIEQRYGVFFEDDELRMENLATIGVISGQIIVKLSAA